MTTHPNYNHHLTNLLASIAFAEKEIREKLATLYILSEIDSEDHLKVGETLIIQDDDYIQSNDPNIIRTFDKLYDLRKLAIDILNTNDLDITPNELFNL